MLINTGKRAVFAAPHWVALFAAPWTRWCTPHPPLGATWRRSWWTTRAFWCGISEGRSLCALPGTPTTRTPRWAWAPGWKTWWNSLLYFVCKVCYVELQLKTIYLRGFSLWGSASICLGVADPHVYTSPFVDHECSVSAAGTLKPVLTLQD